MVKCFILYKSKAQLYIHGIHDDYNIHLINSFKSKPYVRKATVCIFGSRKIPCFSNIHEQYCKRKKSLLNYWFEIMRFSVFSKFGFFSVTISKRRNILLYCPWSSVLYFSLKSVLEGFFILKISWFFMKCVDCITSILPLCHFILLKP